MNKELNKLKELLDRKTKCEDSLEVLKHMHTDYMSSIKFSSRFSGSSGSPIKELYICEEDRKLLYKISNIAEEHYENILKETIKSITETIISISNNMIDEADDEED